MSKKNKPDTRGFVFSTDPNFRFEEEQPLAQATVAPPQQPLKIRLETKHRGGKTVSLVLGFIGTEEDLEELGKKLKNYCLISQVAVLKTEKLLYKATSVIKYLPGY